MASILTVPAYQSKDVIAYAADMIVYINGVDDKYAIPINNKPSRLNFTNDITTCNIELSVDNAGGGSATFSLAIPRHSQSRYFKYGRTVFKPMMEIEVFMKGRFLDRDCHPVYYQTFWGMITDVNVDYSGGQHTIEITCVDILYFWSITRLNTKPTTSNMSWDTSLQLTEYISIFNHLTPYQIMLAMAYVLTGSLIPPSNSLIFGSPTYSRAIFAEENRKAMHYWEVRNRGIGQRFRMFGLAGGENGPNAVMGSIGEFTGEQKQKEIAALEAKFPRQGTKIIRSTEQAAAAAANKSKKPIDLDGSIFDYYFPLNAASQSVDFGSGENQSKLEIAQQVAEFMNYEFYMDVTGELIFKPPFYNLDVRSNDPVSVIRDLDIISFNVSETARELITRLDVFGAYSTYYEDGDKNSLPYGSYVDYRLAEEYGFRSEELTRSFLSSPQLCTIYAISELSRYNAKRFSSSLTIVGRPELRLGYPIYVESMDTFFYVKGIAHSYSATGKLETTLTLEGMRRKHLAVSRETGKVVEGASWDLDDPFRPRLRGVPNVVLIGDVPTNIEELDLFSATAELLNPVPPAATSTDNSSTTAAASGPLPSSGDLAFEYIKGFEGFRSKAEVDENSYEKKITIGHGTTRYANGKAVALGDTITPERAKEELNAYLNNVVRPRIKKIPHYKEMTKEQIAALESFGYNFGGAWYGIKGFETITSQLKNKEWDKIPATLKLYNKGGGQVLGGLIKRRAQEAAWWQQGLKGGTAQSTANTTTTTTTTQTSSTTASAPAATAAPTVSTPEQYRKTAKQFWSNLDAATYPPPTGSKMSVPAGTMRNDAYSKGLRRIASTFQGIELQSYGRTLEVIQKGVFHADLFKIPVSDEAGYEVIGGFGYGRGAMLDPTGKIIPSVPYSERSTLSLSEKAVPAAAPAADKPKKEEEEPGNRTAAGGVRNGKAQQTKTATTNPKGTEEVKKDVKPPPFDDLIASLTRENPKLKRTDFSIKDGTLVIDPKLFKDQKSLEAYLTAHKLAEKYQISNQIMRIWDKPDLMNTVVENGHAFKNDRDYVSRYLGSTKGEFNYNGAGFYLADFGGLSSFYSDDYNNASLAETTAAILADNVLRQYQPVYDEKFETQVLNSRVNYMPGLGTEDWSVQKTQNKDPNNPNEDNPEQPSSGGVAGPASGSMGFPTAPGGRVGSRFGMRQLSGEKPRMHQGVDIGAGTGARMNIAADNGKVTHAAWTGGYGGYVEVNHGNGLATGYAHMVPSLFKVKVGDAVTKGQDIGPVGNQGHSRGAHLHFEVRKNPPSTGFGGVPVDPLGYIALSAQGSSPSSDKKQSRR